MLPYVFGLHLYSCICSMSSIPPLKIFCHFAVRIFSSSPPLSPSSPPSLFAPLSHLRSLLQLLTAGSLTWNSLWRTAPWLTLTSFLPQPPGVLAGSCRLVWAGLSAKRSASRTGGRDRSHVTNVFMPVRRKNLKFCQFEEIWNFALLPLIFHFFKGALLVDENE